MKQLIGDAAAVDFVWATVAVPLNHLQNGGTSGSPEHNGGVVEVSTDGSESKTRGLYPSFTQSYYPNTVETSDYAAGGRRVILVLGF